jgi:hypothetical protein
MRLEGVAAIDELTAAAKEGRDAVITPMRAYLLLLAIADREGDVRTFTALLASEADHE